MTTIHYPGDTSEIRTSQVFRGFVRMLDWMRGFDAFRMEGDFTIIETDGGLTGSSASRNCTPTPTRSPTPSASRWARPPTSAAGSRTWPRPTRPTGTCPPAGRLPLPGEFSEHYIIDPPSTGCEASP